MNIKFTTKVFGAVAAALMLSTSANAACGKMQIADMNWASASLMANVDAKILEAMGCETELVVGATMTTWASMDATGKPDVAPEVWANAMATLVDSAVAAGRVMTTKNIITLVECLCVLYLPSLRMILLH